MYRYLHSALLRPDNALALTNQQHQNPADVLLSRVTEQLAATIQQTLRGMAGTGVDAAGGAAGLHNLRIFPRRERGATPVRGAGALGDAESQTPSPHRSALQDASPSPPLSTSPAAGVVAPAPAPPADPPAPPPNPSTEGKGADDPAVEVPTGSKFSAAQDAADFEQAKELRDRKGGLLKRPAASSSEAPKKVPKKDGKNRPAMMKAGSPTVYYCDGKINRNEGSCKFRVFLKVGDRCDRAVSWKTCSQQEAWSKACLLLEEASSGR